MLDAAVLRTKIQDFSAPYCSLPPPIDAPYLQSRTYSFDVKESRSIASWKEGSASLNSRRQTEHSRRHKVLLKKILRSFFLLSPPTYWRWISNRPDFSTSKVNNTPRLPLSAVVLLINVFFFSCKRSVVFCFWWKGKGIAHQKDNNMTFVLHKIPSLFARFRSGADDFRLIDSRECIHTRVCVLLLPKTHSWETYS